MNTKVTAIILAGKNNLLNHYLEQLLRGNGYSVYCRSLTTIQYNVNSEEALIIIDYEEISDLCRDQEKMRIIGFVNGPNRLVSLDVPHLFGLLEHSCDEREFLMCVEQVASGRLFYSSQILEGFKRDNLTQETPINNLTKREREILILFSKNYTMSRIADQLHISPHTVNNHLANIRNKLHLQGPNSLVRFSELNRFFLLNGLA